MEPVFVHIATAALSSALIHFVWQGALLAAVYWLFTTFARPTATARYVAGIATLLAMAVMPIVTTTLIVSSDQVMDPGSISSLDRARPILLWVWAAGTMVMSIRVTGGWLLTERLRRRTTTLAPEHLQRRGRELAERLGLTRRFRLMTTPAISVPMMVGWLRPVILLPASAVAGVAPAPLDALIAHELAHMRRHDYLVNLGQTIVEALLFYHPAVWWVSRQVRTDRELCCDDIAVESCGDRVVYASALADLAAATSRRTLGLAASDGSLAARVRRLLAADPEPSSPATAMAFVPLVTLVVLFAIPDVGSTTNRSSAVAESHAGNPFGALGRCHRRCGRRGCGASRRRIVRAGRRSDERVGHATAGSAAAAAANAT